MPEPRKKQSPVVGHKLSKYLADTTRNTLFEPDVIVEVQKMLPLIEKVEPEKAIEPPLKDVMRTEPVLFPFVVVEYDGEKNDNGFYHGSGECSFKDGIVYKGEFRNGKIHGVGKLSWPIGTSYSGEFVENQISGKGLYTWTEGGTYEGEVFNGLRHGYGTYKCHTTFKSYTGDWRHGKRQGKGILYYNDKGDSYYDGDWQENQRSGFGIRKFSNGNMYEGEWKENVRCGHGTIYWYDQAQKYTGYWADGCQNGRGEHIWYLHRVSNTQYPLRNYYVGDFVDGKRHGMGAFYYASGAVYKGGWKHNMKHGQGRFAFKNGCVFNGKFCDDHMLEFPGLILSGMATPDITRSGIPVQSPHSLRADSILGIPTKATDVFLDVDIDELLMDYSYDLEQRQEEVDNILRTLLRYASQIKHVYKFYSCLGLDSSVDNTTVMEKLQYFRFLKDHYIHRYGLTLMDMERQLGESNDEENCFKKIFLRDFLNYLIRISYILFRAAPNNDDEEFISRDCSISVCFQTLLKEMFSSAEQSSVKGFVFASLQKSVEVKKHLRLFLDVYFTFTDLYLKKEKQSNNDEYALTKRHVVFIYKELQLFQGGLTSTRLVDVLNKEEPIEDDFFDLDVYISPLEFVEVLVASSQLLVNKDILKLHVSYEDGTVNEFIVNILREIPKEGIVKEKQQSRKRSNVGDVAKIASPEVPCISGVESHTTRKQSSNLSASYQPKSSSKHANKRSAKMDANKRVDKEQSSSVLHQKHQKKDQHTSRIDNKTSPVKSNDPKTKQTNKQEAQSLMNLSSKEDVRGDQPNIEHQQQQQQQQAHNSFHNESHMNNEVIQQSISTATTSVVGSATSKDQSGTNTLLTEMATNGNKRIFSMSSKDEFELWVYKLNIFVDKFLWPAIEKRKTVEEFLKMNETGVDVVPIHDD